MVLINLSAKNAGENQFENPAQQATVNKDNLP
jgi:hypothetical protein